MHSDREKLVERLRGIEANWQNLAPAEIKSRVAQAIAALSEPVKPVAGSEMSASAAANRIATWLECDNEDVRPEGLSEKTERIFRSYRLKLAKAIRDAFPASPAGPVAGLREVLEMLVDAVTPEVNEKGAGGYLLARLADARAALATNPTERPNLQPAQDAKLSDKQVKHMVDRFLGWKLPKPFNPDGGISFNESYRHAHGPSGTNLFDAQQATAMVQHMIEGLPQPAQDVGALREAAARIVPYLRYTIGPESPGHHPTMPSAVSAFMHAFGWRTDEKWREYMLAALASSPQSGGAKEAEGKHWRELQKIRQAILGDRPMCRDCADCNGRCQDVGLPCDPTDAAIEQALQWKAEALRLTAEQQAVPEGMVLVPQSALDWLMGAGPDHNGNWFGEGERGPGAFWWRSKFTAMCRLPSSPRKEGSGDA